ncbi:MAG TPA: NAD-dependent epimerase/dehydratase family protein [Crenotrichaceae bacterium]|nr:NAD-dependent epimerase/dehydratase family protein [Crenotrichaceae bacterium]
MDYMLDLIGRDDVLFAKDIAQNEERLQSLIGDSAFLVLGGAGTIGQAVVKEIFQRHPKVLHVVDISENNLVELVRDIRSSFGYISGDFKTFALDISSKEFDVMLEHEGPYDYVLNLSALKHVRSEKDAYTLMRMISVNIENTIKTQLQAAAMGAKKYFAVSTDKAANPVNMMGASKRIMEQFLMRNSTSIPVSTARFANVAFSDGSLLHGFNQRIQKRQPIAAPSDVRRYFVTPKESGELCLASCLLGNNREIFFPKLSEQLHLITFEDIARRYLTYMGYQAVACATEDEARSSVSEMSAKGQWPCFFMESDTTGEKDFEEFFMENEMLDMNRFQNIGIVSNSLQFDTNKLDDFVAQMKTLRQSGDWNKEDLVAAFCELLPEFHHLEKQRFLDQKM